VQASRCEAVAEITRSVVDERELASGEACVTGSMRALLGYDPAMAMSGGLAWWLTRVHPDDLDVVTSRFSGHREDRGVEWSVEYRVRRADNTWAVVQDRGRSLPATTARPAYILGVLSDVTDTRALRDEVHRAKRLEIVARLAAGVAHDYNNVLSAISGFASVLMEGLEGQDEHLDDLRQIETLVTRGAALSHNLLGLAKPREGSKGRLINVGDEIRRLAPTMKILLGAMIECTFDTPAADRTIYMDPNAFDQVLLNLAANARDAMPNGGTLHVRTFIDESMDRPRVRVDVRDTGCGMPAQVLASIFQPYYTTKGERRGTGLGLWLVREIVQSAGGNIRVDSKPNVGTIIVMEFPAVDEPPSGEPIPLPRSPQLEKGRTLLFIEDEDTVRSVTQRILERSGFRVIAAESGTLGLELLERHRHEIDAIITDLQMPGIAGATLVRRIREIAPEIGCIVMSGLADRLTDVIPIPTELELFGKPCEPSVLVRNAGELARHTAARRTPAHAVAS
jgi:signal transduction histidine kinase/CheY-like chemotaxis protein